MSPAVSVVIATHNYGRFLAGALDSLLGQTFGDFEAVVVDDGSEDDTPAVVRPYLRDPRLRYERTAHQGQPRAKNTGIRRTRAPLVAFLDADDLWLPAKLERQVALFQADPALGVACTRRRLIDEKGRERAHVEPPLYRGHVLGEVFRYNFVCFSSVMIRRAVLDETGLFDESIALAIDYELWLRVALRHRFDYVDEPLVLYRTGHANLSRRQEERLLTTLRIMHRFVDERGGRAVLPAAVVGRAFAETYSHLAWVRLQRRRLAALPCYLRALAASPRHLAAWEGLASLPLPEAARRWLHRALAPLENGLQRFLAGPPKAPLAPASGERGRG